ncbi:DUF4380 domain-containing protein [Streptomonospora sp. S1-112]|uniref:DUF4380 domain-containing protein n=1 Tax=Streptomonospora mangrovi TaxID=2883123 RepID=A0A9X3NLY6_9ACTN|nr:DUF4380 domain-containing protein [Streptomonospora mangrovi]MDA0564466.1 DUF4380 domain-containing protein [Streptomonospora mangrovi]
MTGRVRVTREGAGPDERVVLDNGALRLTAAPGLGGRVLSLRLAGREFLYRNPRLLDADLRRREGVVLEPTEGPMSAWNNVGGDKTWPAPQGWSHPGEWAGPPDPVLDSGAYAAEAGHGAAGAAVLTMTSGDDPRTGLRLTRRITLEPGARGYRLELTARNTSAAPRTWALWNVTQLDGAAAPADGTGGVYVGVRGEGPHTVPLVAGDANPRVVEHAPGVLRVPAQDVVGKVGFPTAEGWLRHVGRAGTLTQTFTVAPGTYPDQGSRVEVWLEYPLERPLEHLGGLRPRDRVVECEVLGPLTDLAPGAQTTLSIAFDLAPAGD